MQLKVDQICQNERIEVGRLGENDANRIAFDFTAWVESYGAGNITLLFQRPTEELIYPIPLSVDGTTATWTVSETDTAISGKAHATLIYTVDEVVKKSAEFFCMIEKVLSANGQTPEPYEDYLAQIVAAGAAAEEAAGIAEGYAGSAEGYAADAKDYADAAKDSKDDAAGSAAGAYQSATDAEAAKDAILNMTATAEGLPSGSAPTVTKTEIGGVFSLAFGIPAGEKGAQGDTGATGAQGERGSWWYVGNDPISAILPDSKDGDLYLQDYNGQVWQMEEGFWFEKGSIRGPKGEDGTGVPSGGTDGQIIRKDTSAQGGAVWQNVDATPTENSANLVQSGGVASALSGKVDIAQGVENAGKVLTVGADGNVFPAFSSVKCKYTLVRRLVLGYSVTTSKPADWEENYTSYYTNTGTADIPVYEAVTGESAPTWEAYTYYSKSTSPITSISALNLSTPILSAVARINAPIHTGNSILTMSMSSDTGTQYKYVLGNVGVQAAATSARTTYLYIWAGTAVPMVASRVGTNAPTFSVGRLAVYGSNPSIDIQSGTDTKIRRFTFELTNGLPVDTTIDVWGVTN